MGGRGFKIAMLVCWLAAMSWLMVQKVLPTLQRGERPDFDAVLPAKEEKPLPVCWDIQYSDRSLGWAASLSRREADGSGNIKSVVHFQQLPLQEIMSELLGTLGALIKPLWKADSGVLIKMTVISQMHVSSDGRLERFVTRVHLAEMQDVVRLQGEVVGNKLHVEVYAPESGDAHDSGKSKLCYKDELDVPGDALVTGALNPQSRMANLHLGQKWTFPVYRPFPPNAPMQMVQATVEREELIVWNSKATKTFLVQFRDDAGSGISIARDPVGKMWVRPDGTVLQQEARIANLQFRFVRQEDAACVAKAEEFEALDD